jgi:hypothetical protein
LWDTLAKVRISYARQAIFASMIEISRLDLLPVPRPKPAGAAGRLLAIVSLLGLAALPWFGVGQQVVSELRSGPWSPAPHLQLRHPSYPCDLPDRAVNFCRVAYGDDTTTRELKFFMIGPATGLATPNDPAPIVRSQRRPEVVTMRAALDLLPRRTASLAIWEFASLGPLVWYCGFLALRRWRA